MPDPLPVDAFLDELDGIVAAAREPDHLVQAVRAGTASRAVAQRALLDAYDMARWMTPDCALLVAGAPDVYAFTMDHAAHYRHWARIVARRTGYLGGPARLGLAACREFGLDHGAVRSHAPMPETIAAAFTILYYVRRSYEEGLAVLACAWEGSPAGRPQEEALLDGFRIHYGLRTVAAEPGDAEPPARELLRVLPLASITQARCREAVRNAALVLGTRIRAMNGWLAA